MPYKKTTVTEEVLQTPILDGMPVLIDDMSLSYTLGLNNWAMWYFQKQSAADAGSSTSCYAPISLSKRGRAGKRGKKRKAFMSSAQIQAVQRKICQVFLVHDVMPDYVGAYEAGRSTVDTAKKCANKKIVVQIDCKDFFPTIRLSWVRQLFESYGYSREISSLIAGLLCTAESRLKKGVLQKRRFLPQGGVASPMVSNRVAYLRIDKKIQESLQDSPWEYTRYSDNIYLTCDVLLSRDSVDETLKSVRGIIHKQGWKTHKVRVDTFWRRQKVLGLVVNSKINLAREDYHNLKAAIHNCKKNGFSHEIETASKILGRDMFSEQSLLAHLRGRLSYAKQALCESRYSKLTQSLKEAETRWMHQVKAEPLELLTTQTQAALDILSGKGGWPVEGEA